MKNFLKEFETFAVRGNTIDLAVAVVIGAAFNQITSSLVNNILTPPIGLLLGGIDFSNLSISLGGSAFIRYGLFLQELLNFLLVVVALFLIVKLLNRIGRRRTRPTENPEIKLLTEIRDALRKS